MVNKKYVYARESLLFISIISIVVGLPLLIITVICFINLKPSNDKLLLISISATFLMIFIILLCFYLNIIKWRKYHNRMVNKGNKFQGKVISFGYKYKSGNLRVDPPTIDSEEYWLVVRYTDNNGKIKDINTPKLAFVPQKSENITCDVYIYNNEVFVTNFKNLYKKKTDWFEIFIYIIIGVVILGISGLIKWIRGI